MFDSIKFNGFIKNELDDLLFNDIWGYYAFNETDLHSAAYYYIREYFRKRGSVNSDDIFVRCEPQMNDGTKPDIVLFRKYDPIYIIELKMFKRAEIINTQAIDNDLKKINKLMKSHDSVKWGFLIVAYDSDDMLYISDTKLKSNGYNNISFIPINLRRKEKSNRQRNGYLDWRKQFDKYLDKHF